MEFDHQHQEETTMMEIDDDQDHISRLPNSVLIHILSSLKTREAVRTSAISTKWRNLWTTPTSLTFDADNMLEKDKYCSINVSHMSCMERYIVKMKRTVDFMENIRHYLSCVKDVQKIETLKVCFTIRNNSFGHNLNQWISFALERKVEEIDLILLEVDHFSAPLEGQLYAFPCDLLAGNSSLKRLRLAHCMLAPGPQWSMFSGFNTLTTLELWRVDLVSVDHLQNLLRNCHNVESLSLSVCGNMEYLKIEHPFCQKLRYLNVNDCPHLKAIALKGINVETLEYKGRIIEFLFNAPRLRTAFSHVRDWRLIYSDIWPLCQLPIDLPQLETLFLASTLHLPMCVCEYYLRTWNCPHCHIEEEFRDINWPPRCPHDQLNEVLITGMSGYTSEIETVIYLLKNATSLRKITIDPRPRLYLGNGKWHLLEASESWTRTGKHKVLQHLTQQLCSPVELLIL